MPKLLGRTSDNRQPMLRIRVARYANADASECGKEKASSPHKPHAEQEAFWIVGVLYKSKHGKQHRKRPQNRRDPPALLLSGFLFACATSL